MASSPSQSQTAGSKKVSHLTLTGAYPALTDLLALRSETGRRRRQRRVAPTAGPAPSRQRGRGMDFVEVRSYAVGDDVRTIDWRVTARTNAVHTKVFAEERERPAIVAGDLTQSLFFGSAIRLKSVVVAELIARQAWISLAAGDRVGAVIATNADVSMHPARRSVAHVARVLGDVVQASRALTRDSQIEPGPHPFWMAIERITSVARNGHRIDLISDFSSMTSDWRPALLGLARGNDVHARIVLDPLEATLPLRDPATVTDGNTRRLLNAASRDVRARYEQRFEQRLAFIADQLTSCGISVECVSTDGSIATAPASSLARGAEA